jgi:hypothetical protein
MPTAFLYTVLLDYTNKPPTAKARPKQKSSSTTLDAAASDFPVTPVGVGLFPLPIEVGDEVGGMVFVFAAVVDVGATGVEEAWATPVALDNYVSISN